MSTCAPLIIGAYPAPLLVRLMAGEAAGIVVPVEGDLTAPVIEWADGQAATDLYALIDYGMEHAPPSNNLLTAARSTDGGLTWAENPVH